MEQIKKKLIGSLVLIAIFFYLIVQPRKSESYILGIFTILMLLGITYKIAKVLFEKYNIIGRTTAKVNKDEWYVYLLYDIKEKFKSWIDGIREWVYENA